MKQFSTAFFILLFSCSFLHAAQDTTEIFTTGFFAGYNATLQTADFRALPGVPNCCPRFSSGTGNGFAFGGLFEYPLSNALRLQLKASYSTFGATLHRNEDIGNQTVLASNNSETTVPIVVDHSMKSTLNAILIEPAIEIPLLAHLSGQLGLATGFFLTSDFEQNEVITSPSNVVFLDGRAMRNNISGSIPNKKSLYLAALGGIAYHLPIGKYSQIVPEVRYYQPFTNISDVSWKVGALQISAAMQFAIMHFPRPPLLRDTVYIRDTTTTMIAGLPAEQTRQTNTESSMKKEETSVAIYEHTTIRETYIKEVPKPFTLQSSLQATGISATGERIPNPTLTIEETEVEETFPLLPYVFFDKGKSDLASTHLHQLSPEEAEKFLIAGLPSDALNVYASNLNILGFRLRTHPEWSVTVAGCNDGVDEEKNNTTLSMERAKAIQQYLTTVWKLGAKQVNVKAQNLPEKPSNNDIEDGRAENRRAEISSSNYEVLKPVTIKEISKAATPPVAELMPTVNAEGGIGRWQLTLRQGSTSLRTFSGTETPTAQQWRIMDEPIPRTEEPVTAVLTATDKNGQQTEARQAIPVRQLTISKKRSEIKNDKRIEKFSLILFDFGKSDLSPLNKTIMAEVIKRIEPNSMVSVYGYADRTGESEYNKNLATRRCNEVAKSLKGVVPEEHLSIIPVGSDHLLYNNDIPEGRSYSRTVQIVLETPVKQ